MSSLFFWQSMSSQSPTGSPRLIIILYHTTSVSCLLVLYHHITMTHTHLPEVLSRWSLLITDQWSATKTSHRSNIISYWSYHIIPCHVMITTNPSVPSIAMTLSCRVMEWPSTSRNVPYSSTVPIPHTFPFETFPYSLIWSSYDVSDRYSTWRRTEQTYPSVLVNCQQVRFPSNHTILYASHSAKKALPPILIPPPSNRESLSEK